MRNIVSPLDGFLSPFGRRFGAVIDPFASLMSTLQSGAAQVIAHPLLDGYMFQDRAGTIPVTASGQLIGRVLDAGGGNYHATAISEAARMVFRDVGGFRWVEYNGINGAYATPALAAPLVDKAQVFAGVRKLSDTAETLVEASESVANSGSMILRVGDVSSGNGYSFASHGSVIINEGQIAEVSTPLAPSTSVITGLGDISGDIATLRIDGSIVDTATGDQGIGNFNPSGTYPLYYGSRAGTSRFFNGRHYATLGPITRFSATNATAEQIEAAEAYYTAMVI